MKPKDWFAFLLLALIWGSSFMWIKLAVQEIGPFTLVGFRLLFGVLFLAIVIRARHLALPKDARTWAILGLLGLINTALPFVLISWGEQHIDSAVASILNGSVPLFTLFIAHWLLKDDRMTMVRIMGAAVGFVGIVILLSGGLSAADFAKNLLGDFAVLAAAALYGVGGVLVRLKLSHVSPTMGGFGSALVADGLVWTAACFVEFPLALPAEPITWISLIILGLLGTGLAYQLYFYLIQSIGSTRASMVTYVMPVVGLALGILFLREPLTWQLALGMVLIVGAVWLVNGNWRPAFLNAARHSRQP